MYILHRVTAECSSFKILLSMNLIYQGRGVKMKEDVIEMKLKKIKENQNNEKQLE